MNNPIEGFFGGLRGAKITRLSPLMFHLLTSYKTEFYRESMDNDSLYWNYRVKIKSSHDPLCTLQFYARNYREAVEMVEQESNRYNSLFQKSCATIESFDSELRRELTINAINNKN